MQTRTVTAHIPIELAEQVDAAAERLERPRGWIVKQALQNWISLEERRHQMTLEGLNAIDEGQVVDHAEITAWIDSLE
ncbi:MULTISPECIES: CopG family ribbon-helix-helix protein [Asticcacaulis]|uniref:CopG family ribbon-helix-helix protein n=1 Tax=Asticcacaulis TaxID=76890 RepID=UPI001AE564A4|nr:MULTISPECIES: ribbon-helix-helix domain-containing protein [Asticcacaulis]MBP2157648.1 putative transcriptional regulator [Asticcacaulis solisilvae]MDR6798693.1 putative transcriptional regulator [Asticcacaulis sp. BE141]